MSCDAVMLCVDGVTLANDQSRTNRRYESGAFLVDTFMELLRRFDKEKSLAVVVAIMKSDSDLIDDTFRANGYFKLKKRAVQACSETVAACLERGSLWQGAVIPVGSVGVGKVRSREEQTDFRTPSRIITEIIDTPEPLNCELPILFMICDVLSRGKIAIDEIRVETERMLNAASVKSKQSFFARLLYRLADGSDPEVLMRKYAEQRNQQMTQLARYEKAVGELYRAVKPKISEVDASDPLFNEIR